MLTALFDRPSDKVLKILARGDCTSRRAFALNPQFVGRCNLVQNEKSPLILFLDALDGVTIEPDYLEQVSNIDAMPRTLQAFYRGQANRSILTESDADLLVIDSYADMNFELWEREDGAKLWIHPGHLKDRDDFVSAHRKLGRRTLEQSVSDAVAFIAHVRVDNPGVPVLLLNQQTEFYPKLDHRREFYDFGRQVAKQVEGAYFGGTLHKDDLELADIGSCGPGMTLHYQASTYRRMLETAVNDGLGRKLAERAIVSPALPASQKPTIGNAPPVAVSFRSHEGCEALAERAVAAFARYMIMPEENLYEPKFTPMVVSLDDLRGGAWAARVKASGGGARLRQAKKAQRLGYFVKRFPWKLHLPDVYDINTSMESRSGGVMRDNYKKTVDEMGGVPTRPVKMPELHCPQHWTTTFGVFLPDAGHAQGAVVTNERLVGYISLLRTGDVILYSQIMGHGDHLSDGSLILLHHEVMDWLRTDEAAQDAKFVMYGGVQNGGDGLRIWKERSGFVPQDLIATR